MATADSEMALQLEDGTVEQDWVASLRLVEDLSFEDNVQLDGSNSQMTDSVKSLGLPPLGSAVSLCRWVRR